MRLKRVAQQGAAREPKKEIIMKTKIHPKPVAGVLASAALLALGAMSAPLHADTFGSGDNTITIDFVTVGNPGNGDDA